MIPAARFCEPQRPRAEARRWSPEICLAALFSFPYAHATRYHGIFANRSRLRRFLPPPPPRREDPEVEETAPSAPPTSDARATVSAPPPAPRRRLPWAQLLRRLLDVDALACPRCSTRSRPVAMAVLAFLTDPDVIAKILRHLGLPTCPPPLTPACSSAGQALPDVAPPPTIRPPP